MPRVLFEGDFYNRITFVLKAILYIIVTAVSLLLISRFVPGVSIAGFYTALVVAVLWGLIGLTVRPIIGLLTLPINLLTFGLFSFILNALLFWFLSSFIAGFSVVGFIPALEGSFILSVVGWIWHSLMN